MPRHEQVVAEHAHRRLRDGAGGVGLRRQHHDPRRLVEPRGEARVRPLGELIEEPPARLHVDPDGRLRWRGAVLQRGAEHRDPAVDLRRHRDRQLSSVAASAPKLCGKNAAGPPTRARAFVHTASGAGTIRSARCPCGAGTGERSSTTAATSCATGLSTPGPEQGRHSEAKRQQRGGRRGVREVLIGVERP